jgi:hypothetical protein
MPSSGEIRKQLEHESELRNRMAVPGFAGGFLYLLSALIIYETLNGAPTVGLLQGLAPALSGVANPAVSPRTAEVKFISHHSSSLIIGGAFAAIAFGALTMILLVLVDATRFRRPEMWRYARPLVIVGGAGAALVSIGRQLASAVQAHSFAVGSDHSIQAAERALSSGAANQIADYIGLVATLALAVGMVVTLINALRVGLLVRWMAIMGMFVAVLIFFPFGGEELEIVQAFWMVMMGVLYMGRWPNGEPPAWAAGEARPWPSQARGSRSTGGAGSTPGSSGAAAIPAPVPVAPSSRKRRRKPGARD